MPAPDGPPMYDFYEEFYRATAYSAAHAELCTRVYGRNFSQHGFADMRQLDFLIAVAGLTPQQRVLELGCGAGALTAYLAEQTGAHFTGVDYSPEAMRQAVQRAAHDPDRLEFQLADINHLPFPPGSFDAILSIDTLYFAADGLGTLVGQLSPLLVPAGRLLIFYSHAADPMTPIEVFPRESLPPDKTPVGEALRTHGFTYHAYDFTEADRDIACSLERALTELRDDFDKEETLFLYENRMGEAGAIPPPHEAKAAARYLYAAQRAGESAS